MPRTVLKSHAALVALIAGVLSSPVHAQSSVPPIGSGAFPGVIELAVDATDTDRRIMRIVETIPVAQGPLTLLYPQWLPGTHSPSARLDQMAGFECADGRTAPTQRGGVDAHRLAWVRDPLNVWAFRFEIPAGVTTITCRFDFLSPLEMSLGRQTMTPVIVGVQWNQVLVYPAAYDASRIQFHPTLTLPAGFAYATALESESPPLSSPRMADGATAFKPVNLETLVDSPLFSGRYMKTFDLDSGAAGAKRAPIRLNVAADREANLEATPDEIAAHRRLVEQADRLFGSRHYAHYDFLLALSDQFSGIGLEHHQSSENGVRNNYFTEWKMSTASRALLPHEYTHSWNGKFRRPADLATPNFNVPMQDSLLWVYEGQTQYWGNVLAARSGLVDLAAAREVQAGVAAQYEGRAGRLWRNLQDTTNQPIVGGRADTEWTDWVRGADYYDEMDLVWLDVDTKIRELSNGKHTLDDFARGFFGVENGRVQVLPYTFDDIVAALTRVQPYDWRTMLRARLDGYGPGAPLDGLTRSGWKLVFDETESEYQRSAGMGRHYVSFGYSLGFDVSSFGGQNGPGRITNLRWNSPAFKAGLADRMSIIAINGRTFTAELLKEAIKANRDGKHPLEFIVKSSDYFRTVTVDYRDGLRYPHLARIDGTPDRLTQILTAKP